MTCLYSALHIVVKVVGGRAKNHTMSLHYILNEHSEPRRLPAAMPTVLGTLCRAVCTLSITVIAGHNGGGWAKDKGCDTTYFILIPSKYIASIADTDTNTY